jgi:hypothetical protein
MDAKGKREEVGLLMKKWKRLFLQKSIKDN